MIFISGQCLGKHNELRNLHVDTPNMVWDSAIQSSAQDWANHLVATKTFAHSTGSGYGENLYYSTQATDPDACSKAVQAWYVVEWYL